MTSLYHPHAIPTRLPESSRYRIAFATTPEQVEEVLRLRYRIFNEELGEGLAESEATGMDRDPFDDFCHHLMVLTRENKVVGTYRMQTAEMAAGGAGFYSDDEYDLSHFPDSVRSDAIEIGRACIAREHRNGRVLFLLWRGLMRYVLHNQKNMFFGCCSLTSQDPEEGQAVFSYLGEKNHLTTDFMIPPRAAFRCEPHPDSVRTCPKIKIPQLMQIYLNYGAKICSPPALDQKFKTIDFLTLLDIRQFDEKTYAGFAG